jgi:hypothetical protein
MILAVDFDQTIHDKRNPLDGKKMGAPLPGAQEALMDLYDAGNTIIIHSTMANTQTGMQAIADWLEHYDIDYHNIVGKPHADYYIDDKALTFYNWPEVMDKLGVVDEL